MFTIFLDDGTEVEANLNCNTWESDTEPDDSVFVNNTSNVSYTTPEGETVELGECKYIRGVQNVEGKYLFFLNPLTETEKIEKQLAQQKSDIDYIMIMEDL